ncbi:hypothetical protein NP493_552g01047 [Ridgeia piscesae]|uniref:GH18 domain-containing protein n=1 Tax=Ridgeia piscesae TaxID=27915 RepID=A0AAD9NRP1_RIDPI|nr:hypothetical protein NP493_552g01047 [Ridgeia piscesae]
MKAIKHRYTGLKTLLSVGGWNLGTKQIRVILQNRMRMRKFAKTSITFLRNNGFDGLDLHFQYPGSRGSPRKDKYKYATLVMILKEAFAVEARLTRKPRLLLTAAVPPGKHDIDAGYEIRRICRLLDFVNLLTYDFHGTWEDLTGINAPLLPRRGESKEDRERNVAWAANYWIKEGCPRRKLVIGMSTYGRSFRLANQANHGVGAPKRGRPGRGTYTRVSGFLAYYEICEDLIKGNEQNVKWHKELKAPYAYKGDMWVSYDNEYSLQLKVKWLMKMKLGGWMVMDLAGDDFSGTFCNAGKYPLISRLNKALKGEIITMS